jgi:Putative transposase
VGLSRVRWRFSKDCFKAPSFERRINFLLPTSFAGPRNAFHRGELQFHGELLLQAHPRAFAAWVRIPFRHDWVVYSKPPFGGPEHGLRYLGAYTHRVAISNSRLVALSEGNVTFRWRDSAHRNKKRLKTLDVEEFRRRFLLHLLPPGFVRILNFGFLANRNRARR